MTPIDVKTLSDASLLDADIVQSIVLSVLAANSPLYTALMDRGAVITATSAEVSWFADTLSSRRTQINRAADDYDENTTSIIVDDASSIFPNSILLAEATGETMLVTAVNTSTNTLTVVRGHGSTAAAASVADNAFVQLVATAMGDGSLGPQLDQSVPNKVTNNLQTFRKGVELTGRAHHSNQETEDQRGYQRRKKLIELTEEIEKALLFGTKGESVDASGKRVTTHNGVYNAVSTNVDNVAGAMSRARFVQFCEMAFAYGSPRKLALAGSTVIAAIDAIYSAKEQTSSQSNIAGMAVRQLLTPFGTLDLVYHPLMRGIYAGDMAVVDPEQCFLRPMQPKDGIERGRLHFRENIQDDEADTRKDEWMAEHTLQYGNENTHAIARGITGAA